ncbi:MAG TPA: ABC transporter permease [Candidatus Dormibacteraeota bacterium]|jgi:phospholipid/cholesterol/gamma-HCH transport system permease protein|nr:ABC transporter permease [Candidatus Dormibacteraeota bacterium]
MAAPIAAVTPRRTLTLPGQLRRRLVDQLAWLGNLVLFCVKTFVSIPMVLVRFRDEVSRLLAEVSVGSGLLFVAGGTVGVIFMLSGAVGIEVGLEGYQGLQILGLAPLSGYVSAFANTRELAPLIAAVALSSQLGCKFTAQLGAMRINEEVDALEMMAVPPIPYLVSTRVIAALVAVVPLYLVGLFAAYVGTEFTISVFFQQSAGTYAHYFHVFIQPTDVIYSVVKVVVFALLIIPVQCYYGFYASGGPEGVGRAAGRGIRSASVLIAVADMLMTFLFWGTAQTVGLSA